MTIDQLIAILKEYPKDSETYLTIDLHIKVVADSQKLKEKWAKEVLREKKKNES